MKFDVIVIGAGPGGSASATFLSAKGLQVLLLDKASFPRHKTCGDGLTPRAVKAVEKLGILEQVTSISQHIDLAKVIAPNGRELISDMKLTSDGGAYMLATPRFDFDDILIKNAAAQGVTIQENCKVDTLENHTSEVIVHGKINSEPCTFKAKYAIVATGASMGLLKKLGFLTYTPKPIIAARAYYENAQHASDCFNFHFNDVTLPGYGWVFPLPDNRINVGIGVIPHKNQKPQNIKALLTDFVEQPYMKKVLKNATKITETQSYPIRTDFPTAKLYQQRTLLVGEAAGLVNPLTGEGIDYALESAEIAAEHIHALIDEDKNPDDLIHYEKALRDKYMPIFNFSNQLINCCLKPFMLNTMVKAATKREALSQSLSNIILGLKEPPEKITTGKIAMKIYKNILSPKS